MQAIAEQVRVIRRGLEQRLELRLSGKHPVTAWLVERAADLLSKFQAGDDGKTGYERWKGKPFHGEEIEFAEKIHYRENTKARAKQNKLEIRWDEGHYLGRWWRTGEAIVGTRAGILRSGTVRRVGGHRRWDRDGLEHVRGLPWQWDPAQGDVHLDLKVRWLAEEEIQSGQAVKTEDGNRMYRLRLMKEDFLVHGFTEDVQDARPGVTARRAEVAWKAHWARLMMDANDRKKQELKENEALARKLQEENERRQRRPRRATTFWQGVHRQRQHHLIIEKVCSC